ncbi:MAG TPA: type II toxin-antitoxin system VapC family toxin [Terracidiphilus sp.]|jgi:PIN domain nuclease of toxin-antitoxin system|nr:type II toxin-antitoxin system VapC family toxin [Terracidiphilus sp.]
MRFLVDTHLLLWGAEASPRLSRIARGLLGNPNHELMFSAASIWEIAIKHGKGRRDFAAEPHLFRAALLRSSFSEIDVTGIHAVTVAALPPIHKDPFDRILIAQAMVEGITLLTADPVIARYPGPIRKV